MTRKQSAVVKYLYNIEATQRLNAEGLFNIFYILLLYIFK